LVFKIHFKKGDVMDVPKIIQENDLCDLRSRTAELNAFLEKRKSGSFAVDNVTHESIRGLYALTRKILVDIEDAKWRIRFAYFPMLIGRENIQGKRKSIWIFWRGYQFREFSPSGGGLTVQRDYRLAEGSPIYSWEYTYSYPG
jgi:hypothetical protein